MEIYDLEAIDVHGHYGRYLNSSFQHVNDLSSADPTEVVARAKKARTRLTIVSPLRALMPRLGGDPVLGNLDAAQVVAKTEGLLQWVVVDPTKPETYEQASVVLTQPKCVGIKIHPEEHGYEITKYGPPIFEFAAKRRTVILTHSGEERSLPQDIVKLANQFPEVSVILAHIGCGWDGDYSHQIRAIQQSHGNLYADTSSAKSVMSGLIEFAVEQIGAERILYGSDTPLYFAPMQRARIDHANISDRAKRLILHDNAVKLLGLKGFN